MALNREWMRVREAAAELDLSEWTVRRLINEGKLEGAYRPSKREFRIARTAVAAYKAKKIALGPEFETDENGQGLLFRRGES